MSKITILIECKKALKKTVKPSGTSSRIYLPKEYLDKEVYIIPINEENLTFRSF